MKLDLVGGRARVHVIRGEGQRGSKSILSFVCLGTQLVGVAVQIGSKLEVFMREHAVGLE